MLSASTNKLEGQDWSGLVNALRTTGDEHEKKGIVGGYMPSKFGTGTESLPVYFISFKGSGVKLLPLPPGGTSLTQF